MKKPSLNIADVQQLHRAGYLNEAKRGYLDILALNPSQSDALHLLGILYAEEGKLEEAQEYLEQALNASPDNPALILHLANVLKAQGLFTKAQELLAGLISSHPEFAAGYNNLGTVYYAQAKFDEAIKCYHSAIDIQTNYTDAYYNLGLAYAKAGNLDEAIHTYQALIELNSSHPGGHFQLACLLMQKHMYVDAIKHFNEVLEDHPAQFETLSNIGTSYLKLGKLTEAQEYYLRALKECPHDTQLLFNLGVIFSQEGKLNEAVEYYLQAVNADPNLYDAHNNLAFIYLTRKNIQAALQHFKIALDIQPHNEAIRHTIDILTGNDQVTTSPPSYISSLFDSYADHFDQHLLNTLNYQVPNHIFAAVQPFIHKDQPIDILDLGCGTGLCGKLFKPYARTLVGVDLSERMLTEAYKKNIYNKLAQDEIVNFLTNTQTKFDLIIAGDVLVYFGDLEPVFANIAHALKPNGIFIFDLEKSEQEAFRLNSSGRFLHNKHYVDSLLAKNFLKIINYQSIPLRLQEHRQVSGHLYLTQKVE